MDTKMEDARNAKPSYGDYIVLHGLVAGKKFRKSFIEKWFKKYVSSDDYDPSSKNNLVEELVSATNEE